MPIVLVGLNHDTAPLDLREKLALSGAGLRQMLTALGRAGLNEAVVLSTCNRVEICAYAPDAAGTIDTIIEILASQQGMVAAQLVPVLYTLKDEGDVTRHLLRVASGLESMVLGEPQILGQVTKAFEDALQADAAGPILSHLFSSAIHGGKRARTETDISRYTTSVSHAAVQLVQDRLGDVSKQKVLIVGVGEMAVLAGQALVRCGARQIACINRTFDRAQTLAADLPAQAFNWAELYTALVWADVVVSATGAPHTVIYAHDIQTIAPSRAGRKLLIVDIAVPRDIEDSVGELCGIDYCDIDDLQSTVDANMSQRQAAIPKVEALIEEEANTFLEWYYGRQVVPVIRDLRLFAQTIAAEEVTQALNRLESPDARTREVIDHMAHRLVNRLLHQPAIRLRRQAADGNGHDYAHTVLDLFGLGGTTFGPGLDDATEDRDECSAETGADV